MPEFSKEELKILKKALDFDDAGDPLKDAFADGYEEQRLFVKCIAYVLRQCQ